ncbi:MAG: complex I subunit 5 family protein [Candidatus Baldrarchaeia archaeon]
MWDITEILLPNFVLIILAVITPLVGFIEKKIKVKGLTGAWATFSFLLSSLLLYPLYEEVSSKGEIRLHYATFIPPAGVEFKIDMLSVFFSFAFLLLGFVAALHSIRYMEHETGQDTYFVLLQLIVAGMIGIVFANDFFNLFVFWEIMCICSYSLVGFKKYRWEAVEAAFKYLVMSTFASVTMLLAMSFLYGLTGSLNFDQMAQTLASSTATSIYQLLIGLIIVSFGVQAAIVPFHFWLPDAHPAAPSPISAMLSGVVITTGIYATCRLLFVVIPWQVNIEILLGAVAVITMFVGNLLAFPQRDVKRLLAYSSIAHMGYIMLGVSTATTIGLMGASLHVLNHAIMKGLAFLSVGAFIHQAEKIVGSEEKARVIDNIMGIGRVMPITGTTFAISILALMGVPSLNGFVSEFIIVWASATKGGVFVLYAALALLNIGMSVAYYLLLIHRILLRPASEDLKKVHEAPLTMIISLIILSILCFAIGIYPRPFIEFAQKAVSVLVSP